MAQQGGRPSWLDKLPSKKFRYSFSKEPRFRVSSSQQLYYFGADSSAIRGGSLDRAERVRTKEGSSPGPSDYDPSPRIKVKGLARFGTSRKGHSYMQKQQLKTPGPTAYVTPKKAHGFSFTIRKRLKYQGRDIFEAECPGPATYTNFYRGGQKSIKFDRATRFQSSDNEIPGPGQYDSIEDRRTPSAVMGETARSTFIDSAMGRRGERRPGPADYNSPDHFFPAERRPSHQT